MSHLTTLEQVREAQAKAEAAIGNAMRELVRELTNTGVLVDNVDITMHVHHDYIASGQRNRPRYASEQLVGSVKVNLSFAPPLA